MLKPFKPEDAARFRDFLSASSFDEQGVRKLSASGIPPAVRHAEISYHKERLGEPSGFHCLATWFFLGLPVSREAAVRWIPAWFLESATSHGLIEGNGDEVVPLALLVPCEDLWVASDLHQQRRLSSSDDHILPLNAPARHLCNFLIRRPVSRALDLCCGNALHALLLRGFSEQVTAADLSPRAEMYGQFNAALNGRLPIESLTGDLLEPVAGRRFDLIVCNPPFVITPAGEASFQANPLELDGLCRKLIRSVPAFLEERGVCQLICEWVQIPGQTSEQRLEEWLSELGCDAWVLSANTEVPETYARSRSRDAGLTEAQEEQRNRAWLTYFEQHRVEAVHGGIITLRRTEGSPWLRIDALGSGITRPVGAGVLEILDAEEFLRAATDDEQLLESTFCVALAAQMEQKSFWSDGDWKPGSAVLRAGHGLTAPLRIDRTIREFVSLCRGEVSLRATLQEFAMKLNVDPVAIQHDCVLIVKELIKRGILSLHPAGEGEPTRFSAGPVGTD